MPSAAVEPLQPPLPAGGRLSQAVQQAIKDYIVELLQVREHLEASFIAPVAADVDAQRLRVVRTEIPAASEPDLVASWEDHRRIVEGFERRGGAARAAAVAHSAALRERLQAYE